MVRRSKGIPCLTRRLVREPRPATQPKHTFWPTLGQNLDNTNSFNENTTCTVQWATTSEWF